MRHISICLCICLLLTGCSGTETTASTATPMAVLIDPGHGGFDGGTIATDGTCEKHINLAISLSLYDLLTICGVHTTLTRNTDQALGTSKSDDMQARLTLYQQAQVVLSIHQNHFDIPKYSGAQVFYSGNHPDGQSLATFVQSAVCDALQPENHREIKKATNGIFLLHNTTHLAVLVECGFLSNHEERDLLNRSDYQQKMAFAIATGYWNYQSSK